MAAPQDGGGDAGRRGLSRADRIRARSQSRPHGVVLRPAAPAAGDGDDADATGDAAAAEPPSWGPVGRIGVYTCNFGDSRRAEGRDAAATALQSLSSLILCVQESTPALHERLRACGAWLLSDSVFAGARVDDGDGMMTCAMSSQTEEIITHRKHSGSDDICRKHTTY